MCEFHSGGGSSWPEVWKKNRRSQMGDLGSEGVDLESYVLALIAAGAALVLSAIELIRSRAQSLIAWAAAAASAAALFLAGVKL